jgi:hypothetical protein
MDNAVDRKKSRQQYMESLQKQKHTTVDASVAGPTMTVDNVVAGLQHQQQYSMHSGASMGNNVTAAERREAMLAEKRKAFFQGQQKPSEQVADSAFTANKPTGIFAPASVNTLAVLPKNRDIDNSTTNEPNLSNWKKLGFASEYAYAKNLGYLNDKPTNDVQSSVVKVPAMVVNFENMQFTNAVAAPTPVSNSHITSNPTSFHHGYHSTSNNNVVDAPAWTANQPTVATINDEKHDKHRLQMEYAQQLQQQMATAAAAVEPASGNHRKDEGFSIGGDLTKDEKRRKQAQYAQELLQQQQQRYSGQPTHTTSNKYNNPHDSLDSTPAAAASFQTGNDISKDDKRRKQQQYALELQMQQAHGNQTSTSGTTAHGPTAITREIVDQFFIGSEVSKDDKRRKQVQYAQELHQQQYNNQQASNQRSNAMSMAPQNQSVPSQVRGSLMDNEPQFSIGGSISSKDDKRRQQQQYAQELQLQQHINNNINNNPQVVNNQAPITAAPQSVSQFAIGSEVSKSERRAKQLQYAQELQVQQQINSNHAAQQPSNMFNIGSQPTKDARRLQQAQYAQELQAQQFMNSNLSGQENVRNARSQFAIGGEEVSKDDRRRKQDQYASDLRSQQQMNTQMQFGGDVKAEKELKRNQQREYMMGLQRQMGNTDVPVVNVSFSNIIYVHD